MFKLSDFENGVRLCTTEKERDAFISSHIESPQQAWEVITALELYEWEYLSEEHGEIYTINDVAFYGLQEHVLDRSLFVEGGFHNETITTDNDD